MDGDASQTCSAGVFSMPTSYWPGCVAHMEVNHEYMQAKQRAYDLAWGFIFQTTERIGRTQAGSCLHLLFNTYYFRTMSLRLPLF